MSEKVYRVHVSITILNEYFFGHALFRYIRLGVYSKRLNEINNFKIFKIVFFLVTMFHAYFVGMHTCYGYSLPSPLFYGGKMYFLVSLYKIFGGFLTIF